MGALQHVSTSSLSQTLENWLYDNRPKTISQLTNLFAEKSFGLTFVMLMALPASPLPTGGASHVLEAFSILLAIELMLGRQMPWFPRGYAHIPIGRMMEKQILPWLIRIIRWCEQFSRPRLSSMMQTTTGRRFIGILIGLFSLAAFVAPPFSDLDVLPSLGVVVVGFSLVFDDSVILLAGIIVGTLGIVVIVGFAAIFLHFVRSLLGSA